MPTLTPADVDHLMRLAGWAMLRHRQHDYYLGMAVSRIDVVGDPNTEYGYTSVSVGRPLPSPVEMGLMDKAAGWLSFIPDDLARVRRIVALRMLWDDDRGRCIHSFKKVSKMVHTSVRITRDEHQRGLEIIAKVLSSKSYAETNFPGLQT